MKPWATVDFGGKKKTCGKSGVCGKSGFWFLESEIGIKWRNLSNSIYIQ